MISAMSLFSRIQVIGNSKKQPNDLFKLPPTAKCPICNSLSRTNKRSIKHLCRSSLLELPLHTELFVISRSYIPLSVRSSECRPTADFLLGIFYATTFLNTFTLLLATSFVYQLHLSVRNDGLTKLSNCPIYYDRKNLPNQYRRIIAEENTVQTFCFLSPHH